MTKAQNHPEGLDAAGSALYARLSVDADGRRLTFEPHEHEAIVAACRLADLAAALEAVVAAEGVTSVGSKGQPVVHPAVAELRQLRAETARLLARVRWPDDGSARSHAGRALARERWSA